MDSTFWEICETSAARFGVPAIAVGSSTAGRVERAAFGCEVATRFRVASITKPFTAAAVVSQLDLDTPAPGWPGVSVADLLAHLSGYDCELGDLARFGDGDGALARLAAELPDCRRWLPTGEIWSYANTGYWLAGHLLAARVDCSYEEVIGSLADAAGLEATDFGEPDLGGTGPAASDAPYPRARRPSGGLVSTVDDLLRFGAWLLGQAGLAAMRKPRGRPVSGVYGLGLAGERVGSVDVWGHGGSYGGFQSTLLLVPARNAVLVGLTNSGLGKQALREVENAWFDALLGIRRRVPETVELDASTLRRFEGRYVNSDADVTVTVGGPGLLAEDHAGGSSVLLPARPIGLATFEIVSGDDMGDRIDFPRAGLARFGPRLSERVE